MRRHLIAMMTVTGILLAAGLVLGDTLEMRDGSLVNSKYAGGTATTVRVETADGVKVVPTTDVLAITFSAATATTAPAAAPAAQAVAPEVPKAVSVPAGSVLTIKMGTSVSSKDPAGKKFTAKLLADLMAGDVAVAKAGSTVVGQVERPLYQEYETELFDLGDLRVEAIRQFASEERSGKLNDAEASRLPTAYFDYEGKRLDLLKKYHGMIAEKLSPVHAAQFAQIEHRVGTVVDLLIASELPLITPAAATR